MKQTTLEVIKYALESTEMKHKVKVRTNNKDSMVIEVKSEYYILQDKVIELIMLIASINIDELAIDPQRNILKVS